MSKIQKMYSYVVEHDYGISPNPNGGFCTLAFCKFSEDGVRRNVVEMAKVGDWIVGTGGNSELSAKHGKLVYAMLVTEKMTLQDYCRDPRFKHRAGNEMHLAGSTDRSALISDHFFTSVGTRRSSRNGISTTRSKNAARPTEVPRSHKNSSPISSRGSKRTTPSGFTATLVPRATKRRKRARRCGRGRSVHRDGG
jgi:hypothetical protein